MCDIRVTVIEFVGVKERKIINDLQLLLFLLLFVSFLVRQVTQVCIPGRNFVLK